MKWKQILLVVIISSVSAIGSVWTYNKFVDKEHVTIGTTNGSLPVNYAGFFDGKNSPAETVDLTKAAIAAVPAVVHIKTRIPAKKQTNDIPRRRGSFDDFFDDLFGYGPNVVPEQRASGSGVLI